MADGKIEIQLDIEDNGAAAKGKKTGEEISKGVEQGLKNVGKQAQTASKEVDSAFKNTASNAKSSFSDVGSAAKSGFSDVGDAAKTAAGDASSAFENVPSDAKGAFSDVSSEAKSSLDGVADAANSAADATSDAFDGVGNEIKSEFDGVDTKAEGVFGTNIPASAAIAGAAVGVLASQVFEIGKNAVNTGMEFDASMAQVAATMGVAVDDIKDLRDFAQQMGETTAFSASQSADALNYMALAGYDAETSMRVLPTVLNLAAAGSMDLARASDMVTDAQSALGLSVSEAETMVDQMAKASSKTNTSVEQLGDAFLTVGGTAKNLKGGTQELAQMLGILADNGVKGSEGGTALRNVILSLSAPTDKAAAAIESLGIEVFDAEGNMRAMPDIMNDMNAAMADMSQKDRTNVLNDIFNKVDLKSVNALLGTSADRFNEVGSAINNAQGAAAQMAETQLDNLAGDVTLLQSATEGFYIAVSDALTPALRGLTQFGTNTLMPFLTEGVKNFDKMAPAVIAAAAAIAFMAGKGSAIKILSNAFDTLKIKIAGSTTAYKQMDTAAKISAVSTKALAVSMKAITSIGLVAVFSALVEAAFMFADSMKKADERAKKFESATTGLERAASGAAVSIDEETGAFKELESAISAVDMDEVLDQHIKLAESMSDTYQEAAVSKAMLSDYGDAIAELGNKEKLSTEDAAKLKIAVEKVNEACGTSYEVVSDNGEAYYIMADGAKVATDEILKVINAQKLQIQAEAAMKNYEASYTQLIEDNQKLADAKAYLAQKEGELAQKQNEYTAAEERNAGANVLLAQEVKNLEAEVDLARQTVDEMTESQGALQSATNQSNERLELAKIAMEDEASAAIKAAAANDDFISGVHSVGGNVIEFTKALEEMGFTSQQITDMSQEDAIRLARAWQNGYEDMLDATDGISDEALQKLKDLGADTYKETFQAGKKGAEGLSKGLREKTNDITKAVTAIGDGIKEKFGSIDVKKEGSDTSDSFAKGIESGKGAVTSASNEVGAVSTSGFNGHRGEAEIAGQNIGAGLADGIRQAVQNVANAAANLARAAVDTAKSVLGIQSPSKVFQEQVGKNVALGVAKGIQNNKKYAKLSASEMSNEVVSAATKKINNLKGVYNISIDYEIGFWKQIKAKTKQGSDGWYKAWANVVALQKQKAEELNDSYNKIISNAQTWLERYKLTHNVSLKYEENYWKKYINKVKKGTDAYYTALANLKAVQNQMDATTLSNAEKWIDHYQVTHNTSLKYEENYWKKYLAKVKKGSDEYYEILKKLNEIRAKQAEEVEEKYDAILSEAESYISRQKRLFGMTYQQEVDYWAKVLKKLKKGTKQYQEAYDNWLEAKNNAAQEVKDKNADLLDAEQDFVDRLRGIQQQLVDDIQAAKDAYADAVESRRQTILSDLNTFERYRKKVTISGDKLIENIQSQAAAARDYEAAMKALEQRIGKGDLYDEIADMGMDGLRYAESLNQMSDEQLKQFVELYTERNKIAQRESTRQNQELLKETNETIKKLNDQAAKDIKEAANNLKSVASDLGTTLSKTVANMAKNVKASADSITSSINSAINSLKKLDSRVSTASTSTSTRSIAAQPETQIPVASVYNGRNVVKDSNGVIQGISLLSTDIVNTRSQTEISLLKGMEALTMALQNSRAVGGETIHYQTIEINGDVNSPDQIAREMRLQQHYGLAGMY